MHFAPELRPRLNRRMLADPFGPPDAVDPLDDYCDGLASRTFRSLEEVKRAHARCDHLHRAAPLWPPAEDQSDE